MSLPRRHAVAATTATVFALAAVGLPVVAGPAAPVASAAPLPTADRPDNTADGPAATSSLRTLQPDVLTPDDATLTLAGVVQNTGDETVYNVQVLPRFSTVPLESRADVGRVATDETLNWGRRYSEAFQVVDEELDPGETQPFSVVVPTDLLDFTGGAGVYVVGVDVMGSPPDSGERIRMHTSRTVVPWQPADDPLPPVPVSLLWPLAARPSLMPDGTFLDNSLAAQIGDGQPLSGLVEAATGAPVTWVIDPDLLDTITAMTEGYQIASATGPVDGSEADSGAASQWRAALMGATEDQDVRLLPYAVPDIGSFVPTEPQLAGELAQRSFDASQAGGDTLPGSEEPLSWLDGGAVTDEVLAALADSGTETVIIPGAALAGTPQIVARLSAGQHALDAVVTDAGLSDAIADAATAEDPQSAGLDVRQRWLAETAMVAREAADHETAPPTLVVAPPIRWRPDPAIAESVLDTWTSIPWVAPAPFGNALAQPAAQSGKAEEQPTTPQPATTVLPQANVAAVAHLHDQTAHYLALLADPDAVSPGLGLATVRASSTGWRDDPAAGTAYTSAITDHLAEQFDQVRVTVPESVTLSSNTGVFPLTVTNDLSEAVNVALQIRSTNVDRLRIAKVEVHEIGPGERAYIDVTAQAAANGKVPIDIQLIAADGSAIGPPRRTIVNATDYGTIGWVIVAAAALLFGVATARRTIRSRRRSADEPGDTPGDTSGDTPDDATGDDAGRHTRQPPSVEEATR